jgi:hypothetical protein
MEMKGCQWLYWQSYGGFAAANPVHHFPVVSANTSKVTAIKFFPEST